jgi:triosephosphate isomerase (TIM)
MKYIFANWKMYLNFEESNILLHQLLQDELANREGLVIFPSSLATPDLIKGTESTDITIGAQNVAWTQKGAYTGAVSAEMYADAGCTHALVGHSERRYIFGETNEDIRKKMEACIDAKLTAVLCVGETEEDKKEDKRQYRIKKQLLRALEGLEFNEGQVIIAYEPVWAIGSGETCDVNTVDSVSTFIKEEVAALTNKKIPVLYGGSIDADNVVPYASSSNIDGILVGGASAKFESFKNILSAIAE